jgi:ribose 5-phosphate isomerase A
MLQTRSHIVQMRPLPQVKPALCLICRIKLNPAQQAGEVNVENGRFGATKPAGPLGRLRFKERHLPDDLAFEMPAHRCLRAGLRPGILLGVKTAAQRDVQPVRSEEEPFEECPALRAFRRRPHLAIPVRQPKQDGGGLEDRAFRCFQRGDQPIGIDRQIGMTGELSPIDKAKFVAAKRSVDFVEDGMRVGLGTGSTAAWMVRCLGEMVREDGLKIRGVPTSTRTAQLARDVGIEVVSLDEARWLDVTIDGADEFDGNLNLIKGGGGALLQEKIVATASDQMIVIADVGKEVEGLGAFPLPVEVVPFGWQTTKALIEELLVSMDVLGRDTTLRMNGDRPFITDEGNYILDLHLGRIGNAGQMAMVLNQMPGVVENGLFIDICDIVIVGHGDGRVETRDINDGTVEEDRLDFVEEDNLFADLRGDD